MTSSFIQNVNYSFFNENNKNLYRKTVDNRQADKEKYKEKRSRDIMI